MKPTGRPKTEIWNDLPNVDWPPNLPKPTVEDIAAAAMDITAARSMDDACFAGAVCRVAMIPWLVEVTSMNTHEIFKTVGYSRGMRASDSWAQVMVSPAGRAIAQAMGCRLREIVRTRMEQTQ